MKSKVHVMDFVTTAEVLDKAGNIVSSTKQVESMTIEGKVNLTLKNSHGDVTYECEKPMESFTVGFLSDFVNGNRISIDNINIGAGHGSNLTNVIRIPWYTVLGNSSGVTYVQQIRPVASFTSYSNTSTAISSSITSTTAAVGLESLTVETGSIRVVLSADRSITAGSGTIKEVCLWGGSGKMIARDTVADAVWSVGTFIKVTWTIDFPLNSSRQMTLNWVKNFVQNIADAPFQDFKTIDGSDATGVILDTPSTASFTKKANCIGAADEDTAGIVIGTSSSAPVYNSYALGAQIATGTGSGQMTYNAGVSVNDATTTPKYLFTPRIKPTTGTATVTYLRTFTNNSGAAITIKEAGLIAKVDSASAAAQGIDTGGSYLLARWLTQDIYVADGNTVRITFQPQITATAEVHSNAAAAGIVVLDDAIRDDYPALKNISMVVGHAYNKIGTKTWPQALDYVRTTNLGGYSDWRLPTCNGTTNSGTTENEVRALWDARARLASLASAQGVSNDLNNTSYYYWSESEYNASRAWYVDFYNSGNVHNYSKGNPCCVRCVR